MGILDDYMSGTSAAPSAQQAANRSVINSYLDVPDEVPTTKKVGTARPPISGATKEQSDIINAQDAKKGGANPRDSQLIEGVKNFPSAVVETGKKNYIEGYDTLTSGASDVLKGSVGKGAAKTALGLLQLVTAPANAVIEEGVEKPITELTGNKNIGGKAALLAGAAVPIVPGAGYVARNLPRNKALSELVDKITSGGRDQGALVDTINAMKADSRIGPADTSPAVLNMTQKLFTTEGDAAKNYLFNTSKERMAGLPQDVAKAYDEMGGVPVNVVQKLNDLAAASKKAGNDLINPALASAKPVNITKTLEGLDEVLKPGVWSKIDASSSLPLGKMKADLADIRKYLANKTEMRTDANDLHMFQSSLRRTAEGLLKKGGSEAQLGHAIMKVRNNLVDDIEASATGYKKGLNAYREEMHIADNFREGYEGVFSNSTKMENRPEFTKQWFDGLTDAEKEAAREGARLAIDSKMGAAQNSSLAGTNLGRSEFNQQKLEMLFGKEETEKLLRNLENTRAIKNTDQKIIEGSQTEMRRAGDAAVALPEKPQGSSLMNWVVPVAAETYGAMQGLPGVGGLLGGAVVAAKAGVSKVNHEIQTKLAKERNLHLSEMAMPVAGPKRDQLIKELEAFIPGPKQSLVTRVANRLPIAP